MIIKIIKTKNFTTMSNTILRDPTISMKTKGLFAYLMTLPEDWSIRQCEIVNHFPDGKTAISTAFNELRENGYMVATDARNTKGQLLGIDYTVYEEPQPKSDNPAPDKPISDNKPLLNTYTNTTSILKTNITKAKPAKASKEKKYSDEQNANIQAFNKAVGGKDRGMTYPMSTRMKVNEVIKDLPIANLGWENIRSVGDLHAKAIGRRQFTNPWDWVNIINTMIVAENGNRYMATLDAALKDSFFRDSITPDRFLKVFCNVLQKLRIVKEDNPLDGLE